MKWEGTKTGGSEEEPSRVMSIPKSEGPGISTILSTWVSVSLTTPKQNSHFQSLLEAEVRSIKQVGLER